MTDKTLNLCNSLKVKIIKSLGWNAEINNVFYTITNEIEKLKSLKLNDYKKKIS